MQRPHPPTMTGSLNARGRNNLSFGTKIGATDSYVNADVSWDISNSVNEVNFFQRVFAAVK